MLFTTFSPLGWIMAILAFGLLMTEWYWILETLLLFISLKRKKKLFCLLDLEIYIISILPKYPLEINLNNIYAYPLPEEGNIIIF